MSELDYKHTIIMNKKLLAIGYIAALALILVFVRSSPEEIAKADQYLFYTSAVNSGVLCGQTSTLLLATSTGNRIYTRISNDSARDVYLTLGGMPAIAYQGTYLIASSSTQIGDSQTAFGGAIYCISPSGAASTTISTIP